MKKLLVTMGKSVPAAVVGLLIGLMLLGGPLYAQSGLTTEDRLISIAVQAYDQNDWVTAARYLTAYIESNPESMQDQAYANQVLEALWHSLNQIDKVESDLGLEISRWRTAWYLDTQRCNQECPVDIDFGTPAGVSLVKKTPTATPRLRQPASPTSSSFPLVCRGGGTMRISYAGASQLSSKPHLEIRFSQADFGVDNNGKNLQLLMPGQCARIDSRFDANDPSTILLKYPLIRPEEFSISWTARGDVQLGKAYEFLQTLGMAEPGLEAFHVYPEGETWVVADTGLVIGPLEVDSQFEYTIGHESLNGLQEGARVYVDSGFTYSSVPKDLKGLTYIRTADADKLAGQGSEFLAFQMNREGIVYVAHDDRYTPKPAWLQDYKDTGEHLVYSDGTTQVRLGLYEKRFPAGTIILGGNVRPNQRDDYAMYTVVVRYFGHLAEPQPTTDVPIPTRRPSPGPTSLIPGLPRPTVSDPVLTEPGHTGQTATPSPTPTRRWGIGKVVETPLVAQ